MDPLGLGDAVADIATLHPDGSFISAKIDRVVEAITEYDPRIDVQWIPPKMREPGDSAFRLVYNNDNGTQYIMFMVKSEEEFDSRVLQRIYASDGRLGAPKYSDVEAAELAAKEVERRRNADSMAEAADMAYHVFRSRKHRYKINKDLIIDDSFGGSII